MHTHSTYRADIDGLRAVAVLAVLFYHAGFEVVRGGFVGVDIFFVISGFLITRILLTELTKTGRINFVQFYLRRARRILPALFVVLLATTIGAVIISSPTRLQEYGGALTAAVLSVSNILFYFESDYFASDSAFKPLLHTWSLGVEEQFYLLWPVLLLWFGRKTKLRIWLCGALGVLSLAAAQWLLKQHTAAVFYLLPFRMVELLLGAGLALHTLRIERQGWQEQQQRVPWLNDVLFLLGLALIAYAIFAFKKNHVVSGCSGAGAVRRCSAMYLRWRPREGG